MSRSLAAASTSNSSNGTTNRLPPPSNEALFLTNLRLLDLDLLSDWPAITLPTLSTKDANQNQKQRIRCVEWALFRLFELWNPEETRDKLQPFFPPLEPLQSLNLRAALYRSLNELKKNGVLGRETTLRKTMLDDCKGEKFWEVLAVFSTGVVKRQLLDGWKTKHAPASLRLSTLPSLDGRQQRSLLPVSMAYRASLSANLRRREALKDRYASFVDLLEGKSQQLQLREQAARSKTAARLPADLSILNSRIKDNWVANGNWISILLYGVEETGDQILGQPFNDVWHATTSGKGFQSVLPEQDLLATLESRIERQKKRLAHWKQFHERLQSSSKSSDAPAAHVDEAHTMRFDLHQSIKIGSGAANDGYNFNADVVDSTLPMTARHQAIIGAMKQELGRTTASSRPGSSRAPAAEQSAPAPPRLKPLRLSSSPRHDFAKAFSPTSRDRSPRGPQLPIKSPGSENSLLSPTSANKDLTISPASPGTSQMLQMRDSSWTSAGMHPGVDSDANEGPSTSKSPHGSFKALSPSRLEMSSPEVVPEEAMAEQILSAIANASPSPAKRPMLSLTERTRLSIAHGLPQKPDITPTGDGIQAPADTSPEQPESELGRRTGLLERTRQSMSLLPEMSVSHKPRQSLAASSKKRQNLYPVNQFETPKRQPSLTLSEHSEENGRKSSTPTDMLFSDDAEYASVFKSRPKLALSPRANTPQEEDVHSIDGAMDFDTSLASSPLGRVGLGINGR